jgi:hypothetical protein
METIRLENIRKNFAWMISIMKSSQDAVWRFLISDPEGEENKDKWEKSGT